MAANLKGIASNKMAVVMTCFAAFGGFLYGYDTGYISGVKEMPVFLDLFGTQRIGPDGVGLLDAMGQRLMFLPSGDDALITSILSAGTFVGALAAAPIGDRLGRRYGIICYLLIFSIGVALQTAATSLVPLVIGRVLAGLGVGGTSCLVPMYQSECAPKHIRGAIVAGYQWMITIGLLIAAVIVNATKNINTPASYRIPIGIQFIWAAILAGGLALLPESPRWLIMKSRDEDAMKSLSRILGAPIDSAQVNEEFAEIAANLHHERAIGATSYLDCFRNGPGRNRLRTLTGMGIQALQQLTGINFIFYYGTTFFQNSGIRNPFIITIITNIVNVVMTLPGIWAVDRYGRRFLLLYGAFGMAVSQLIVAAVGVAISTENLAGQRVLIAFVCIFIAHFAATWGPLAWVVTGEIYPLAIRGKAMSMSTASNWLLNFAIGYSTPYLVNTGPGNAGLQSNVFWIWGGCCVLCFIFVFFCVPETMGLSLEQVDILYRNSSIIKSNAFRRKILADEIHDEDTDHYKHQEPKLGADVKHSEETTTRDLTTEA